MHTITRRALGVVAAGALAATTLAQPATADSIVPAPLSAGGYLTGWGDTGVIQSGPDTINQRTVPAAYADLGFIDVAAGSGITAAVTGAGEVVAFGNAPALVTVPPAVKNATVVDVEVGSSAVVVLTDAGTLRAWGTGTLVTNLPANLTGVTSIAVGTRTAVAVKSDGTAVGWGDDNYGQASVPAGLDDIVAAAVGTSHAYALTEDGTVTAWGRNSNGQTDLPAAVTTPGNVVAVSARAQGGLAILADGSLASWGEDATTFNQVPTSLAGKRVTAISAYGGSGNLALVEDGSLVIWGQAGALSEELLSIPEALSELPISRISLGQGYAMVLVEDLRPTASPVVTGTAKVGQTLTATPPTFTGAPTTVTNQWLADGIALPSATGTGLTLTSGLVGKRISFASTATDGTTTKTSTSAATAAVLPATPPPPTTSRTTTKVSGVKATRKATTAKITVTASPKKALSGTIKITIKRGKKTVATTTLKVPSTGKTSFNSKKLKKKVRNQLAKKGKYTLTAKYSGARYLRSSSHTVKYKVK